MVLTSVPLALDAPTFEFVASPRTVFTEYENSGRECSSCKVACTQQRSTAARSQKLLLYLGCPPNLLSA